MKNSCYGPKLSNGPLWTVKRAISGQARCGQPFEAMWGLVWNRGGDVNGVFLPTRTGLNKNTKQHEGRWVIFYERCLGEFGYYRKTLGVTISNLFGVLLIRCWHGKYWQATFQKAWSRIRHYGSVEISLSDIVKYQITSFKKLRN